MVVQAGGRRKQDGLSSAPDGTQRAPGYRGAGRSELASLTASPPQDLREPWGGGWVGPRIQTVNGLVPTALSRLGGRAGPRCGQPEVASGPSRGLPVGSKPV